MKLTLILLLVIIALLVIIIAVTKIALKTKVANSQLKSELKKQKENTVYLAQHAEELAQIQTDSQQTENQINGAKSDEEVLNIINSIVDANNSRLRK